MIEKAFRTASLTASRPLPLLARWTSLSVMGPPWSAHQSAAMLCHLLSSSGAALSMYHLRVESFSATWP